MSRVLILYAHFSRGQLDAHLQIAAIYINVQCATRAAMVPLTATSVGIKGIVRSRVNAKARIHRGRSRMCHLIRALEGQERLTSGTRTPNEIISGGLLV